MESQNANVLSVRLGRPKERRRYIGGRSKSRGRSKSPGDPLKRVCWNCGKPGHFKRNCRAKSVERGKGPEDTSSKEKKPSSEEGGDVHLASTSTQSERDFWLIDSGASFHMTPHREWFSEYEKYNGNVFLGDDSPKKIMGRGRVKLLLKDGRIRTLPGVLHIPGLARNFIYVRKMADAGVKTVFEKDRCKMIRGAMVLMRGV